MQWGIIVGVGGCSGVSEVWWLGVGYRMCLVGLGSREQGPPTRKGDIHQHESGAVRAKAPLVRDAVGEGL